MTAPPARLPEALTALRDAVAAAPLGLVTPDQHSAWRTARAVVDQTAERRLVESVEAVAEDEVLAPMAAVRQDHARFCAAVQRAAGQRLVAGPPLG